MEVENRSAEAARVGVFGRFRGLLIKKLVERRFVSCPSRRAAGFRTNLGRVSTDLRTPRRLVDDPWTDPAPASVPSSTSCGGPGASRRVRRPLPMARALLARALALALFLAASRPARGALEDDWPTVSAARRAVARVTGAPLRALLCAVSNCRDGGLPTPPGGRYARWGPYDTRLVALTDTDRYGFPDALVACPVAPPPDAADVPGGDLLRALLRGVGLSSPPSAPVSPEPRPAAPPVSLPGVAWSHGGSGSCDGTAGFANTADGYSPEMTGDDKGLLASRSARTPRQLGRRRGVSVPPRGVPVGDGASTLNAARMLAERQPCRRVGALVREDKLALAGYSLGAGRALRAASSAANGGAFVAASRRGGGVTSLGRGRRRSRRRAASDRVRDRGHERAVS